jgi:hypothetical protein
MKSIGDSNLLRKKTVSIVTISILVASSVLVLLPILEPKAGALLYHDNSTAWEDQDFGGGLDYNGDIAGDNKITWHPANNSHVIRGNYLVDDDYILELEAGVIVQTDPGFVIQVGQITGGSFYANGSVGNPVLMGPNGTGVWEGIYLLSGSYGLIQSTLIDQLNWVYVSDSTLDVNTSAIYNTNSVGLYGTGSNINATLTGIFNTNAPGLYVTNSNLFASNCFITDAQSAAIYCDSSEVDIRNSDLYGLNNSAGSEGGHAIYVTGASAQVMISNNNNIIGGSGGPDIGAGGGGGGYGIFSGNYDGQLNIENNLRIQGGKGGNNYSPGLAAGDGGMGIYVSPLSDLAPSPAVTVNGNILTMGGRGGDNDAIMDGDAGRGGSAIRITDDPVGSAGEAVITSNIEIIGGGGGHNHADSVNTGWTAGDGGEGISLSGIKKPASVFINQNPNIQGGAGGNNTGLGNNATVAGEGGNGILLWNATDVTIQESMITGGHGGNNTKTGVMASAGDGGNGVFLYYPNSNFQSEAMITACVIYGGEGGDDYVGLAGALGGAGEGGSGIYSSRSSGTSESCEITGGKGGNNYGPGGSGGDGGYGFAASSSLAWSVSSGSATGGKGGDNFNLNGGGGNGEIAAYVSGTIGASFSLVSYIKGGDGGDADIGDSGPGDAAMTSVYLQNSFMVSMMRNDIITGIGGYNGSSGVYGANGTYGIYADNLDGDNTFLGNDITTNYRGGNTYGIRLILALTGSATIEGNDIYTNNVGVYVQDSNGVLIGSGNNIYNNNFGVYLFSSDATMGPNNLISNNGYGVYCYDSSPTITQDQIIDSSTIGMFFTSNSNAIVEGCTIENSNVWNVYSEAGSGTGSSPQFYNSSLSANPGGGEFYQNGDSHPWLLNTTFDKAKTGFGDSPSNITVNWYMHVLVVDTGFLPVPGATVWINDTYGTNLFSLLTDGSGRANWNIVTEYIENTTGYEYYYTPHNVSALESGMFGNALPDMTLSRVVIIMLDGISVDIPLKLGWNMISIPIDQPSTKLVDVLGSISGRYTAVQWFNISDASDKWKHYHISKPSNMNDLSDIDKTMAIWILMKGDDVLPLVGQIPVSPTTDIQLKTGWNFVGYPSVTSRVAGNGSGEAFESISGFVDMVQYYDAADSANPWKEWDPGALSPDDLTDVNSGMGLWIHVTGDCTWSVDW